jgi:hypothetical protein
LGFLPALGLLGAEQALLASEHGLAAVLREALSTSAPDTLLSGLVWESAGAVMNPLLLLGCLLVLLLLAAGVVRQAFLSRRRAEPWLCGYASGLQGGYAASHYYGSLKPLLNRLAPGRIDSGAKASAPPDQAQKPNPGFPAAASR